MRGLVAKVLVGAKVYLRFEYLPCFDFIQPRPKSFNFIVFFIVFDNIIDISNLILNVWVLKFENKEHKSPILHPIIYFILRIILKSTSSNQKSNNDFF